MHTTELSVPPIDFAITYDIRLVSGEEILDRWDAVEGAVETAFRGAQFSGDDKDDQIKKDKEQFVDNPVAHIRAGAEGRLQEGLGHIIAEDDQQDIVGGVFCVPRSRQVNEADCKIGWVFTAKELSPRARVFVLDGLIDRAYDTAIHEAGYDRFVVSMGTLAGAKAITRRYGLEHEPMLSHQNRWVATQESFTHARQRRSTIHG